MKNVTISMDEDLASWVRVEAAKADKSVSAWIAEMLGILRSRKRAVPAGYHEAMRDFLSRPAYDLGYQGKISSREDFYDAVLHRHERVGVREGSKRTFEADKGGGVAGKAAKGRGRRAKRPGSS